MSVSTIFYVTLLVLAGMITIRMHELATGQKFFARLRYRADVFFHRMLVKLQYFIFVWARKAGKKAIVFTRHAIVDGIFHIKDFVVFWWSKFELYLVGKGHVKKPSAVSFFWKTMAEYKSKHTIDDGQGGGGKVDE